MNILVYFENPISPMNGGTERATYNMIQEIQKVGYRIFTLSKHSATGQNWVLPNENLLHSENISFVNSLLSDNKIDVIINEGGNTSDVQLFNHYTLTTDARIITCLHFCTLQGFGDYYYSDVPFVKSQKDIIRILKMPYTRKKALSLFRKNYTMALEYGDAFVVLDDVFKIELSQFLGTHIFDDKIYTIPNMNSFVCDRSIPLAEKENRILYVGRLQYKTKRIDRLLKACKKLGSLLDTWHVDIVGDGPDRGYYERLAQKLGLKSITFHGTQSPESFYTRAKIIALTSTHESFGMTLIEGMAFGCVPIAFDSYSSVRSIIENGRNGFLVKPFSIDAYATTLAKIMTDVSLQKQIVANSKETLRKFRPKTVAALWEKLLGGGEN